MQREEERSTVPCLMPFLSVVLPVRLSRWVEHPFRRGIHPGDGRGRGARQRLVLLHHVRLNRNYIIATCRLVCVDLAQGGKQPVAVNVDLSSSRCITAGSKITALVLGWVEDSALRSDSRGFAVAGSFSPCAFAWIVW